ncbi:hypothetical protein [Flavobacterium sp. Leaf359]|uniref:hypothetical protein n=1 Tax=Flavobacterium sp. Leaf359 TaxID=1736351 RepID=UPI000AE81CE1|nr:hypothetical protein [Flavobacterium sp. Leaf359]
MAQKATTDKERKEKEQIKKKEHNPLIQVDKHGDPISNFIANFKRQFKEAKGLLNWGKLFGGKPTEPPKQPAEPESVIGATKTVVRSDYKNADNNQNATSSPEKQQTKIGIVVQYSATERQMLPLTATLERPL